MIEPKAQGAIRSRLPLIGGLLGIGSLLAIRLRFRRHRPAKPTAAQLMGLDDAAFAEFIQGIGLKTISTSRPGMSGGSGD